LFIVEEFDIASDCFAIMMVRHEDQKGDIGFLASGASEGGDGTEPSAFPVEGISFFPSVESGAKVGQGRDRL
jgi:hypothetical protein